jgi:hypothetical protein
MQVCLVNLSLRVVVMDDTKSLDEVRSHVADAAAAGLNKWASNNGVAFELYDSSLTKDAVASVTTEALKVAAPAPVSLAVG